MAAKEISRKTGFAGLVRFIAQTRTAVLFAGMVCVVPATGASGQPPWPLWHSYLAHFSDAQGRIIDRNDGERTTSEGQAYAMFFALVANDRESFDRILEWTQNNLCTGGLARSLPYWLWGKDPQGKWGVLDRNSASDADLWISYTLLQAGRLWNDERYRNLGEALASLIQEREVADLPHFGPMLLPGEHGFHEKGEYTLNPSYLPPQLVRALANEITGGSWSKLAAGAVPFLQKSASAGYAMDWVDYEDRKFSPAVGPGSLAGGSYDAVRVYLWAGMLASDDPERDSLLHALPSMAEYVHRHGVPPERVSAEGRILQPHGDAGFSAAVLPYLEALSDTSAAERQRARLAAQLNPSTGLYGETHAYYEQNLALFATGWDEGRFRFDRNGQLHVAWSKP
jgi:endo-1,4-beta-D-glucanase Y